MSTERVGIVRVNEQRLDEALARVVGLLGDLGDIVPRGSRVLIKPNFVFPPTNRGITHPRLVEAVVRLAVEAGAGEIMIGEGSADVYTSQGFRFQGMDGVAARYGAELVDLNLEEGVRKEVPEGLGRDYIMVPRAVAECDVLISLPVFKIWGNNPLSLSLKNLIGVYGARYYGHNKDSRERADDPEYAIPGDLGTEMGAHQPNAAKAICAMNAVVPTQLAIVDALEGSDGGGHWIRLDTLVAGTNPVATDVVACQMAGFIAAEYELFRLCRDYGLGPSTMEEIEVVGEKVEDVSFDLKRLRNNVLEMPIDFCLNLLNTGELEQMQRALKVYGLIEEDGPEWEQREGLLAALMDLISAEGYYERALGKCTDYALKLLDILVERGGTAGSMVAVERAFGERYDGLYCYPAHRVLTRLGLAYAVDSAAEPYYLLPEGVMENWKRFKS
ncbi:MAG: DUF362 domain-containing protein [Gemmatimonadetes bacterium]|jgi:uncharacterized protein (DUF362 family)|nr:DUF362 domain-containing protein [Gemmatimonadota bacterium]